VLPEHLRALVYLLFLTAAVFALARAPATDVAVDAADFKRRRNLWFALTLVAFLSGDFWVYVFLTAVILLTVTRTEQNPVALFLSLLFVLPPMGLPIPAFGILNYLFTMNHVRLLCLTLLLPAFFYLVTRRDRLRFGSIWPDRLLLAYLAISFCVAMYATTFTNVLRHSLFLSFLEVFLPYYVTSRGLRDIKSLRDTSMTFVVTALVLAAIALFEMFRGWLLYVAVRGALGVPWDFGNYFDRAGTKGAGLNGPSDRSRLPDGGSARFVSLRAHARNVRLVPAPRSRIAARRSFCGDLSRAMDRRRGDRARLRGDRPFRRPANGQVRCGCTSCLPTSATISGR
jgi:hypothetical protein